MAGLLGGGLFVVLLETGAPVQWAVWSSVLLVLMLRMVSVSRDWNLPKVVADDSRQYGSSEGGTQ